MANRRIELTNQPIGHERNQEILDGISQYEAHLPQAVDYGDIDRGVLDFLDNDINLAINDDKTPVFFMTIQKWTEFNRTWGSSDEFKDVKLPFITIVRDPDIQQGTNQNQFWNVPGRQAWTYKKVPTLTNGRVGMDLYKIPQPTSVDMTFQVRFFSNRMSELNTLHNIIQRKFNARQHYIYVKGHPMPLTLESVGDESKNDDIDGRKYYVQLFEILCSGYILDDKDFQIVPSIDRSKLTISAGGDNSTVKPNVKRSINNTTNNIEYEFNFNINSDNTSKIKLNENTQFIAIEQDYNVDSISYNLNGELQELPFDAFRNDVLTITIKRVGNGSSSITLLGDVG